MQVEKTTCIFLLKKYKNFSKTPKKHLTYCKKYVRIYIQNKSKNPKGGQR